MQEVRLRQARRHRKALRAVQGKSETILERPQESRRRSRWRAADSIRRREAEEEIRNHFADVGKMILNNGDNKLFLLQCTNLLDNVFYAFDICIFVET